MHSKVILYSGGLDSYILGHIHDDAFKLYVDTGSRYADKEMAHLPADVHIHPDRVSLRGIEREDAIVPSRNAYLALIAANYGDDIMLGATEGDLSTDKDEEWAKRMTALLQYMYSGHHFKDRGWLSIRVTLPIKRLTKSELVAWFLQNYPGKAKQLAGVVSCYDAHALHCGQCKACIRKWAALAHNGVEFDDWEQDPGQAPAWNEVVEKLQRGEVWRSAVEDRYTREVLRKHGWRV